MKTEKKTQVLEAFKQGMSWRECGKACSIDPSTIWRWSQADPEFAQAIKEACADPDSEVEAVTFSQATDPDPANNTLRMFWLKSRMPQRYKDRLDVTSGDEPICYFERAQNPRDQGIPAPAETA